MDKDFGSLPVYFMDYDFLSFNLVQRFYTENST